VSRAATCMVAACLSVLAALVLAPVGAQAVAPPRLAATASALYAPATGQMLEGVNGNREVAIASTTKLMTALVVLQHVGNLDTVFTYPDYRQAADDSQIGLEPGEKMTVHDLLIAMMLPSADDAAEDLAYNVGHGSVGRFVAMMNAEARRLGLTRTHYTTPIGLDTPGNHSTADDLVHLAAYDLSHEPFFAKVVAMRSAHLATGPEREVTNLNDLVRDEPWVDGVKTGHTNDAGYVLVASGHRDGMQLISAVMGTDSESARDTESLSLLDYGFGAFHTVAPVRPHEVLGRLAVRDRPGLRVAVRAGRGYTRIVPRSAAVHVSVSLPRQLIGPLPAGTVVGSATVRDGAATLATIPVLLPRRLTAVSRLTLAGRVVTRPWMLAIMAALLAAGAAGVALRSGRWTGRRGPRWSA
jgi:D-alanyl-D-alanine carboxypeptidase (penicillin-binding protein 5/6)